MTQADESEEMKNERTESKKTAFDHLYSMYSKELLRTAYLITGNVSDSEDIVQESFIKCYRHMEDLKEEGQFRVWLYQIMKRTAWRYCRKSRKEQPMEDSVGEQLNQQYVASAQDEYLQSETECFIREEINKLAAKQRLVIVLYYYNQLSVKEIAKIAGCLEGTVKSRLYAARKQLSIGLKELQQSKSTHQVMEQINREERCHAEYERI